MNKYEPSMNEEYSTPLVDAVIEQIKESINNGYTEAIDELLRFCPRINLIQYLPEEEWEKYMTPEEKELIYK